MDFTFNDDQLRFHDSVRAFLTNQVPPERQRELWAGDSGRSDELWAQLAELGLTALNLPEAYGGLGLDETDWVLPAQECGYAALAEPLLDTVLVGAPLLAALGDEHEALKADWLGRIAEGRARLAVGHPDNLLVADAHVADLLILGSHDEVHAVPREAVQLTGNAVLDPARRLFAVAWTPSAATCVARGEQARALWSAAFERGALACAAQQLGLARRMVDLAVDYSFERKQFGKPIGSFQLMQAKVADMYVALNSARSYVYNVARACDAGQTTRFDAAGAILLASESAVKVAGEAIQALGGAGYTKDWPVERYWRDAKLLDIGAGTNEIRRMLIGRELIGAGA